MPTQKELPGTETTKIPAVTRAARAYIRARDERMELTKAEKEKKDQLYNAMKNAEVDSYVCDGIECWIEAGEENVKARKKQGSDESEDGE